MDEQTELLNRIARCVKFAESYEQRYQLYVLLRELAKQDEPDTEEAEKTLHDIEEEQRKVSAR